MGSFIRNRHPYTGLLHIVLFYVNFLLIVSLRISDASNRPRKERRTEHEAKWTGDDEEEDDNSSGGYSFSPTPAKRNGNSTASPCAKALFDFEPGRFRDFKSLQSLLLIFWGIQDCIFFINHKASEFFLYFLGVHSLIALGVI